ncbi:MAG: FAD-binding oxidoreductase [Acidimicrobiia bacterium]
MRTSSTAISDLAAQTESIELEGLPDAELAVAPRSQEEAARILRLASEHGIPTLVWGGGSHQGIGGRVEADLVLSTSRFDQITEWEADDLTLVVEAGLSVSAVEAQLAERGQTALLPEGGDGTVGGVVATGVSGWQRLRYGPTRDRVLEVVLVTGDGRTIRGGGRVVKNVTGYDLPRLAAGSLGSLGIICQVCLKLWPRPDATATVTLDDAEQAVAAYRPLAVIEDASGTRVYLGGHPADVEAQVAELDGQAEPRLVWPESLTDPIKLSLRVPVRLLPEGRSRIPTGWTYQIQHGVGEVLLGCGPDDLQAAEDLRGWAEEVGGSLVIVDAPDEVYAQLDPWGTAPASLDIQRRIVSLFDPMRILNPGRLPGGL